MPELWSGQHSTVRDIAVKEGGCLELVFDDVDCVEMSSFSQYHQLTEINTSTQA